MKIELPASSAAILNLSWQHYTNFDFHTNYLHALAQPCHFLLRPFANFILLPVILLLDYIPFYTMASVRQASLLPYPATFFRNDIMAG